MKIKNILAVGNKNINERTSLQSLVLKSALTLGMITGANSVMANDHQFDQTSENSSTINLIEMPVVAKIHHLDASYNYELSDNSWNYSEEQNLRRAKKGNNNNSEFQVALLNPKTNKIVILDVSQDIYSTVCVGDKPSVSTSNLTINHTCSNDNSHFVATMENNEDNSNIENLSVVTRFEINGNEFNSGTELKTRLLDKRFMSAQADEKIYSAEFDEKIKQKYK